ncbi:hypothetical protein Hypma_011449 [Hypsizygus marmoreus]|uniref:Uncharacterized protein n=1 Tax=Hypsizygus marmoreus TaxID=39966 RepID=A0A369JG74_HYPMA|nr:hypothetical protein Hypma_011449 [Hypsizygus marmoreus]
MHQLSTITSSYLFRKIQKLLPKLGRCTPKLSLVENPKSAVPIDANVLIFARGDFEPGINGKYKMMHLPNIIPAVQARVFRTHDLRELPPCSDHRVEGWMVPTM